MLGNIIEDSTFWVATSFFIFVLLTYKPIKKFFSDSLDKKISDIKSQIDQSIDLKRQSVELLNDLKKKQIDSKNLVDEILAGSKKNVYQYEKEFKHRLNLTLEKRESSFQQKINNELSKAEQNIKKLIVETSVHVTRKRIENIISLEDNNKIILNSLKKIKF